MRRAALERPLAERAHRRWAAMNKAGNSCVPVNKFRKFKPGACGRPQCHVCHSDKLLGIPTIQEMRASAELEDFRRETAR